MALRKISTTSKDGFTLVEILVVMGLFAIVGGLALFISLESFRSYSFRSERDSLISTLAKARSEAMSNICYGASCTGGKAHGVHLEAHRYVIFQGNTYHATVEDAAVDEVIDARYLGLMVSTPSFTDIVFSQLSGVATPNPSSINTITLVDTTGKDTSVITINAEGGISWTN